MEWLLWFLLAIGFITLIGHLLWKFFAALFGYEVKTRKPSARRLVLAPRPGADRWATESEKTEAHLNRLVAMELLDAETAARVVGSIHEESRRTAAVSNWPSA